MKQDTQNGMKLINVKVEYKCKCKTNCFVTINKDGIKINANVSVKN